MFSKIAYKRDTLAFFSPWMEKWKYLPVEDKFFKDFGTGTFKKKWANCNILQEGEVCQFLCKEVQVGSS